MCAIPVTIRSYVMHNVHICLCSHQYGIYEMNESEIERQIIVQPSLKLYENMVYAK